MASISVTKLDEHDALQMILDCKRRGSSGDKFLRITNLNKNNFIDIPAREKRDFDNWISTKKIEVLLITN